MTAAAMSNGSTRRMRTEASTIHSPFGPNPTASKYHQIDQMQITARSEPAATAAGSHHAR